MEFLLAASTPMYGPHRALISTSWSMGSHEETRTLRQTKSTDLLQVLQDACKNPPVKYLINCAQRYYGELVVLYRQRVVIVNIDLI